MRFLNDDLYLRLSKKLDEIFKNTDRYMELHEIDRKQADSELTMYTLLKAESIGNRSAREYIINLYAKILLNLYKNGTAEIMELVDFEDILKNPVEIIFEILLSMYDVSHLINQYITHFVITEKDIREIAIHESTALYDNFSKTEKKLWFIAQLIYAKEYGQDCLDSLQYNNINEVGIIDKDYIYIIYKGDKIHLEFLHIEDEGVILNIQKKASRNARPGYDEQNPTVVTSKDNSSRITVAGYDATPAQQDLYYNERIFNLKKITLENMRDIHETINNIIYDFLCLNQRGKGSHFVTGSDMGIGKSTFLLAMMEKIRNNWGIGILDTQNELQAKQKYPWKNILTLIQNPRRTIADLFVIMLKMARDILYVGEITMPSEVAELINASLRLNAGVGATMHSTSPFEVVTNLRNLMLRTEMYNNAEIAEADIARGLDIIVHLCRHPYDRKRIIVENIVEVTYLEQDIYVEPVITGSKKEKFENLLNMAQIALQKYLYRRNYRYNEIFRFDYVKNGWTAVNLPSTNYFNKISRYVDLSEIESFKQKFEAYKAGVPCE